MKPLIFDATPLIYLTKAGLGNIFEELKDEKFASPQVKVGVVDEGRRRGVPDAIILEKMFQNGVFSVKEPVDKGFVERLLETRGLHITDAEVIAVARELGGTAIMDDEAARKTAKIYGISYAGTPYVLMRAIRRGLITRERSRQAIREIISSGWRCDVEAYDKIMDAIEKL